VIRTGPGCRTLPPAARGRAPAGATRHYEHEPAGAAARRDVRRGGQRRPAAMTTAHTRRAGPITRQTNESLADT
jgi:hypothetical protein